MEGHDYFVGDSLTIADLSYLASLSTLIVRFHSQRFHLEIKVLVSSFDQHFGFNIAPWRNVNNWYERMKEIPGFEECEDGAREFGAIVKGKILNSFGSL